MAWAWYPTNRERISTYFNPSIYWTHQHLVEGHFGRFVLYHLHVVLHQPSRTGGTGWTVMNEDFMKFGLNLWGIWSEFPKLQILMRKWSLRNVWNHFEAWNRFLYPMFRMAFIGRNRPKPRAAHPFSSCRLPNQWAVCIASPLVSQGLFQPGCQADWKLTAEVLHVFFVCIKKSIPFSHPMNFCLMKPGIPMNKFIIPSKPGRWITQPSSSHLSSTSPPFFVLFLSHPNGGFDQFQPNQPTVGSFSWLTIAKGCWWLPLKFVPSNPKWKKKPVWWSKPKNKSLYIDGPWD